MINEVACVYNFNNMEERIIQKVVLIHRGRYLFIICYYSFLY